MFGWFNKVKNDQIALKKTMWLQKLLDDSGVKYSLWDDGRVQIYWSDTIRALWLDARMPEFTYETNAFMFCLNHIIKPTKKSSPSKKKPLAKKKK